MWYVIQTITGKEEELISIMDTLLEAGLYRECFVIRAEWMKRLGGQWQIQTRPLFPGYVFVDTSQPEALFLALKGVPRFSKIIGNGRFEFTAVEAEEQQLLERMMGQESVIGQKLMVGQNLVEEDGRSGLKIEETEGIKNREYLVRCSLVETTETGEISEIRGALKSFGKQIEKISLHKRYAVVRVRLLGEERTILLGIRLRRDGEIGA